MPTFTADSTRKQKQVGLLTVHCNHGWTGYYWILSFYELPIFAAKSQIRVAQARRVRSAISTSEARRGHWSIPVYKKWQHSRPSETLNFLTQTENNPCSKAAIATFSTDILPRSLLKFMDVNLHLIFDWSISNSAVSRTALGVGSHCNHAAKLSGVIIVYWYRIYAPWWYNMAWAAADAWTTKQIERILSVPTGYYS